MDTKTCVDCKLEFPLDNFYNSKGNKGGKATCCKSCSSIRNKKSRSKRDPEELKKIKQEYDLKNKERHKEYHKKRREVLLKTMTEEELKKFRLKRQESKRIHRAKKYGNGGRHSESQWQDLLKICNYICLKCKSNENITRDHIKPLTKGGTDDIENIQPLCRSCNSSKNKWIIIDYRTPEQLEQIRKLILVKKCPMCNKIFETYRNNKKFCNKECLIKYYNNLAKVKRKCTII